ncbi:MAG: aspartate aminotransferase family protein [Pseudomonadota bacterium]
MSHVFHRHTKANPPTISHGDGCYLIDTDGKQYFDGSGGAAVSCLGHSNQDVTNAIKTQLDQVAFAHTGFFTSQPAEELAETLIQRAPDGLDRVYFVSGGSEAMESAIKLARQYYLEIGEKSRHRVIARRQSYHGNTLGALAAGGNEWRREPFAPLMIETTHIAPCYQYRERLESESEFEFGQRVANELEAEIVRLGPENVMAFVAEPVVGATLGAVPPVEGYFQRIREICDHYGILLILDEVMCGMGRTGSLFASEQDGIVPDIVSIAKGLGAGYQPIGATLCSKKIYAAIEAGSGFFQHGYTYIGHPAACAGSLAVLNYMHEHNLIDKVVEMGGQLMAELHRVFSQHPHIGDIRGRGLFLGLEIVEDRNTKACFDPSLQINKKIKKNAFESGLMCYPMGGTIDGKRGDHVLLAPPFIMESQHVDEIVSKLSDAIDAALS